MRDEIKLILKNKNKNSTFSEYVSQHDTYRSSSVEKNKGSNLSRLINTLESNLNNNITINENNDSFSMNRNSMNKDL
jgi:hypothetical protein